MGGSFSDLALFFGIRFPFHSQLSASPAPFQTWQVPPSDNPQSPRRKHPHRLVTTTSCDEMNAQNSSPFPQPRAGRFRLPQVGWQRLRVLRHFLSYLAKSLTEYPSAHSRWISDLKLGDKG